MVPKEGVTLSIALRLVLFVGALLMLIFVISKIRKSQLFTSDAIFWFMLSVAFVLLAAFPQIAFFLSNLIGVESPANLVFLVIIAILLVKELFNTVQISQLRNKFSDAVQNSALQVADDNEKLY